MKDHVDQMMGQALQRARGVLVIEADCPSKGKTSCAKLRQEGSFRALFPRTDTDAVEAVMLNTAGGITGGDIFQVRASADDNATLTVTTQAAERIYRAQSDVPGQLNSTLQVGANARLNWLPQETILFDGCALSRKLKVSVTRSSTFLMVEPVIFGRHASNEVMKTGDFMDHVAVTCEDQPMYIDGCHLSGNIAAQLEHKAVGQGAGAMANIVLYTQNAGDFLEDIRALLPTTAGATAPHDDLLLIRALAHDSYLLRKTLVPVLTHLNNNTLPKNWRL